jgi:thiamine biosynthesis protein ThiI
VKFILKLHPEIIIKGDKVRRKFIKRLRDNTLSVLGRMDAGVEVKQYWDKIEVQASSEAKHASVLEGLKYISGIQTILEVQPMPLGSLDFSAIEQAKIYALDYWREQIAGKTFAVRVKRSGNQNYSSLDAEREIGGHLFHQVESARVSLKNPQVTVAIEIHDDQMLIVRAAFSGLGGFPIGTQSPVLSLMSGGYDSTVASYLSMRRGCRTHFVFFNLGGSAHEVGVKQVSYYLWQKYGANSRVAFVSVPFEETVKEILTKVNQAYMGVVLKRQMLKVAEIVAKDLELQALVTGEAVGQVSSQTIVNLNVIDRATPMLVLRPLIMTDKEDIMAMAREIGTEVFARNMPEYCGVTSDRPTVSAKLDVILEEEAKMDIAVFNRALKERVISKIDELVNQVNQAENIPVVHEKGEALIIDIRAPKEVERHPLAEADIVLPFFEINHQFAKLDQSKDYLLYCAKGVMSQLHGLYLQDKGYHNLKIYRPH